VGLHVETTVHVVGRADGARPLAPVDVAASWERATVRISWRHSSSSTEVLRYDIQYRTVGQWVPLTTVPGNSTSYNWTTASRGTTYQFRLFAVAAAVRGHAPQLRSEPSPSVSVQTTGQSQRRARIFAFRGGVAIG